MSTTKSNIINFMEGDIFKKELDKIAQTRSLEQQIRSEVPFFRNLLIENFNNDEIFHGYVNKIVDVWREIISNEFTTLIRNYNEEHLKEQYIRSQLVKMADDHNRTETEKMLDGMSIDTPGIYSLTNLMKKQTMYGRKYL